MKVRMKQSRFNIIKSVYTECKVWRNFLHYWSCSKLSQVSRLLVIKAFYKGLEKSIVRD